MTFLAPAWLWLAAAAAGAVTLLHFFARQRPRPAVFPTARFVPDVAARAPSASRRPTDLLLLVLRVLALLAAGLAFARPHVAPARRPVARVVVLTDSGAAARDSASRYAAEGDTIVASSDLPTYRLTDLPTLSSGLIQAIRASSSLRERADSLELVIVSAFDAASFDAATDSIRALWPGRARLVRVDASPPEPPRRIEIVGAGDDPLRATIQLLGARTGAVTRIVRGTPSPADSAFARAGGVLVVWPRDVTRGAATDTVGAVVAGDVVVVAPFSHARNDSLTDLPTDRLTDLPTNRPIAHWVDGLPAATEHPLGSGYIRDVAIPIPSTGDLVLRQSLRRLVDALSSTCASARPRVCAPSPCASARLRVCAPESEPRLALLRRPGPLVPARRAPEPPRAASLLSAWLLAAAAALLLIELAARPRVVRA